MCSAKDREVHARAHLGRQRRIERPAGGGRAARHEERRDEQDRGGRQQPEAPVVHARERHVGRADHERHLPVREADERRHDRAEHHDEAVHRGELVEEVRLPQLQPGLEQLGAQHEREDAAHDEHGEAEPQVQRADVLVVGRRDPAHDPRRMMRVFVVAVTVIVCGFHLTSLLAFRIPLFTCGFDLCGRDHVAGLVGPGVALVGDDRGDVDVAQVLERRHRGARLAVQHDVHVSILRAGRDFRSGQRREGIRHAHAVRLMAGDAVRRSRLSRPAPSARRASIAWPGRPSRRRRFSSAPAIHCAYLSCSTTSTTIGMKPWSLPQSSAHWPR